jgi:hypothetical protein
MIAPAATVNQKTAKMGVASNCQSKKSMGVATGVE